MPVQNGGGAGDGGAGGGGGSSPGGTSPPAPTPTLGTHPRNLPRFNVRTAYGIVATGLTPGLTGRVRKDADLYGNPEDLPPGTAEDDARFIRQMGIWLGHIAGAGGFYIGRSGGGTGSGTGEPSGSTYYTPGTGSGEPTTPPSGPPPPQPPPGTPAVNPSIQVSTSPLGIGYSSGGKRVPLLFEIPSLYSAPVVKASMNMIRAGGAYTVLPTKSVHPLGALPDTGRTVKVKGGFGLRRSSEIAYHKRRRVYSPGFTVRKVR